MREITIILRYEYQDNVGVGYGWVMAQYTTAQNVEGIQPIKTP
jgi:hypothetical protein